jgi:peptidoglycan hydrolase-like protein with peptidoglycan-binding domain
MVTGPARAAGGSALGAFAVLVVPLAVGAALAVWALAASPLQSAASVQPVIAQVEMAERNGGVSTTATLLPAATVVVKSQSSGVVTASSLTVGTAVSQGQVAFEVDGLPVVAYVAASPLYRDITPGLRGRDVTTAQQLLVDLEYLEVADGVAGPSTQAAVRAFNADHGRGTNATTLSLASLLWIPSESDAPHAVTVQVGDVLDPQMELYSTTTGHDSVSVGTTVSDDDRTLTIGAVTVPLPAGQTAVTDVDDVRALLSVLADRDSTPATVADAEPREVGTVPASAVVVDAQGRSCYFTGVDGDPVPVDATDGAFGMVDVAPDLVGTAVLVNPRATREDLACDS